MLPLSKSDFLEYRHCAKAFWLKRHRPEATEWPAPSAFDRMLMADGYAVEAQARRLIETWPDHDQCQFQVEFVADGLLLARVDLVKEREDGALDLYEIKGSTSLKGSAGDHVVDACFQQIVVERAGFRVRSLSIIHVNGEYVRVGEIDPTALLTIVDVTGRAEDQRHALEGEIGEALALIAQAEIDERGCSCRHSGSPANHCASFAHFNRDLTAPTAHLLPRISEKRLKALDAEGRLAINAVHADELTPSQLPTWTALTTGNAVINSEAITAFIASLTWPLHFYDYETFGSAVPIAEGYRPHAQIPVQFSLHRLHKDGQLEHFEFLADQPGLQGQLAEKLIAVVDQTGSLLVWNESFEKACNRRLIEMHPQHKSFFLDINSRTIDLMAPFKADYVHPDFLGSTSIKKVLPVLCPDLSYAGLPVHDGSGAMEAWSGLINEENDEERVRMREELLAYCKLDTLAMLEIFAVLRATAEDA